MTQTAAEIEHFDMLILGAGLSGIDAAWHLQKYAPKQYRNYVILENRERIGGTWDLFRYPGIRSDSDMLTMGYGFRPWTHPSSISPGKEIRQYIEDTARDAGIDKRIRFRHKVLSAAWSSETGRWTVEALKRDEQGHEERVTFTASFLFSCTGYYRYESGYTPEFAGRERFKGTVVHPQQWPEALDYKGKRVIVIGSGATAATLVPTLAKSAGHVTMLQRSPTYFISRPEQDSIANFLRKVLPPEQAYAIPRWKNIALQRFLFTRSRKDPARVKAFLIDRVRALLKPNYDVATHFTPRYNPWDQRLCLVPDGDLFTAINEGRASVVTDEINTWTETGIALKSGKQLEADIIVTATGLHLQILGGIHVSVDGAAIDFGKTFTYRGVMYSGVPNLASIFGYTNASWTLRADLICEYVCRLLNYMDAKHRSVATPTLPEGGLQAQPWLDFSSGYITRSASMLPKQGQRAPWQQSQNYLADRKEMRTAAIEDGCLVLSNPRG
jgi:cation diffusion facilitator CzcD-associated flavoprotein CzcO